MPRIIASSPEPLGTIVAVTAVLGLRIGETLALRGSDVDFAKHLIRVRQSVDAATRTVGAVKSKASSADLPMSRELEQRLRAHLLRHDGKSGLLFVTRCGRSFSGNKLREKLLHPLLDSRRSLNVAALSFRQRPKLLRRDHTQESFENFGVHISQTDSHKQLSFKVS